MSLLAWVLLAMALLAPRREHAELAGAIARVVDGERPLFRDDEDRHRTVTVIAAVVGLLIGVGLPR